MRLCGQSLGRRPGCEETSAPGPNLTSESVPASWKVRRVSSDDEVSCHSEQPVIQFRSIWFGHALFCRRRDWLGRHLPSSLSEVARRHGRSKSLGGHPLPRLAKSINSPAPRRSRGTYPPARYHRRYFGIRATASGIQHPSIRLWRARHRRPHPHPHGRSEPHPAPRGPTPKATGKVIEH